MPIDAERSHYHPDIIFVASLNSLGRDLPQYLFKTLQTLEIEIPIEQIPQFIVVEEINRPIWAHESTAIGEMRYTADLHPVFCVTWETLVQHAQNLQQLLTVPAESVYLRLRLEDYCLKVSMVHLLMQALPNLDEDTRQKVVDQFILTVISPRS